MRALSHHDSFFKAVLQQPERAWEYFRVVLPSHLADRLNFDTLRLESGSFMDEHLSESFSDLIYSVRLRDSDAGLYLSLLLEQKGTSINPVQWPGTPQRCTFQK